MTAEQRAAADRSLAAGGVAVFVNEVVEAATTTVSGERYDDQGQPTAKLGRHELPATFVAVPQTASVPQAVLSPAAARELGVEAATVGLHVTGATVTVEQEQAVDEAVGALVPYTGLYVERGYQADDASRILLLILGGLGGVLMLGGTLTTTYLALSDARPDLATLGAVGAAPRTRRAVAGSFAVVVALVGGVVGALVGFVPGIAVTYPLTSTGSSYVVEGGGDGGSVTAGVNVDQLPQSGPFLEIPWLLIGTLVIALPLLTGLVVAATTRSRLPLVARLD
jgi:putative ABC transport system permease protein